MRELPSIDQMLAAAMEPRDCAFSLAMSLESHAHCAEMLVAWGSEVERLEPVTGADAKAVKRHRKVFEDPRSLQLLQTIWIESQHVGHADLDLAGLSKTFGSSDLTCHKLATELARTPEDLPGKIKEVKRIIDAAVVFGLVEIATTAVNRKPIAGTDLLHKVMVRMTTPVATTAYPAALATQEAAR